MSIIGEHRAAATAIGLEEIILRAIEDPRWGDVRSAVMGFVKEEMVDWYYFQCADSYGIHFPHPKILEKFPHEMK